MIRLIMVLPIMIILFIFLFCNQDPVQMRMLGGFTWNSSVGIFVLIIAFFAFLLGSFTVWLAELRQRRRARKAEQQVRQLESQITDLQQRYANIYSQLPDNTSDKVNADSHRTFLPPDEVIVDVIGHHSKKRSK